MTSAMTHLPFQTPGTWTLTRKDLQVLHYEFVSFHRVHAVILDVVRPCGFQHTVLRVPVQAVINGGHHQHRFVDLHILNVHMLMEEGYMSAIPLNDSRRHEFEQLTEFLRGLGPDANWLVGGDMNVSPHNTSELVTEIHEMLANVAAPRKVCLSNTRTHTYMTGKTAK